MQFTNRHVKLNPKHQTGLVSNVGIDSVIKAPSSGHSVTSFEVPLTNGSQTQSGSPVYASFCYSKSLAHLRLLNSLKLFNNVFLEHNAGFACYLSLNSSSSTK